MKLGRTGRRVARIATNTMRRRQRQTQQLPPLVQQPPALDGSVSAEPASTSDVAAPVDQTNPDAALPTSAHVGAGLRVEYCPTPDGQPDPGEIVWTWVPYEDQPSRGKDRPVLIIGSLGDQLAGLMLSSQDHDLDAEDEAKYGRYWMDVGAGEWDSSGRPSEVRLDRLLPVDPERVRREGATLDKAMFDEVVAGANAHLS